MQNRLPNARILYVSATGATTPENLAYPPRPGLWGGPEAPFPIMAMDAVEDEDGGVTMVPVMVDGAPWSARRRFGCETRWSPPRLPAGRSGRPGHGAGHPGQRPRRRDHRPLGRVVVRDGRRVVERRSASAAKAETDAFMAGKKRVLVFPDAGGAGRSYHADLGAAHQ